MNLLLFQCAVTLFMTGVIWFVQVVHYPLFGKVGNAGYKEYQRDHARLTGFVVAPPMLLELVLSFWIALFPPDLVSKWQGWTGFGLVVAIWLSTGLAQIPQHNTLAQGYDAEAQRRLVSSNWLRTVFWTLRSGLVLWMLKEHCHL